MEIPPGLIVTLNPPSNFFSCLDSFYTQLDQLVIVDNGSNTDTCHLLEQEAKRRGSSLSVIFNETNLGIATALNQGFGWAIEKGCGHIIAFDQDSQPFPGMISTMLELSSLRAENNHVAVVAPVVVDSQVSVQARYLRPRFKFLFERVSCQGDMLVDVTYVITSGALYNLVVYQKVGPFRNDFFIDYVDTEYCLRARENGYTIVVACKAHLNHRQGDRQKRLLLGSEHYPTFHSPRRWYFISRNRIPMIRLYALRFPHWFLYELVASLYIFMKMLLFEPQKMDKLRAVFHGTLDGLRGRMGNVAGVGLEAID